MNEPPMNGPMNEPSTHEPSFRSLDYRDAQDGRILVELLDAYATDPMGGGEPLGDEARAHLVERLAELPHAFSIVGELRDGAGAVPVALANCFVTLSSFSARPVVNVHDLAVLDGYRGRGLGRGLLEAVEREARGRGARAITLEVLEGNRPARAAYERFGFVEYRMGGAADGAAGAALFRIKRLGAP